jgi:LPXTG-motif cell wall-anchored protein
VNLALFIPSGTVTNNPNSNGDNQAALKIPTSWLVAGGIVAIGAVAGAAFLVKRSKKK